MLDVVKDRFTIEEDKGTILPFSRYKGLERVRQRLYRERALVHYGLRRHGTAGPRPRGGNGEAVCRRRQTIHQGIPRRSTSSTIIPPRNLGDAGSHRVVAREGARHRIHSLTGWGHYHERYVRESDGCGVSMFSALPGCTWTWRPSTQRPDMMYDKYFPWWDRGCDRCRIGASHLPWWIGCWMQACH